MSLKSIAKMCLLGPVLGLGLSLGGCGLDEGIQLNGKIFDAVGLNTGSVKSKEPKLADRAPLVVPPALDKLPEPGTGKAGQPDLAEVQDHDAKHQVTQADLQRQQDEYCRKHYQPAVAAGDASADSIEGPMGLCRASVFTAIKNWNKDDSEAE